MIVILSMTGCGYARVQTGNVLLTAEIKSVNSRYLDINCKTPRAYSRLDEKIKALVGTFATRGKIDVYLSAETAPGEADTTLSLDEGYLKNYLACLKELRDGYGLKDDISVMTVAANRDVFTYQTADESTEELWARVEPALRAALEEFSAMKRAEGARLSVDMLAKIDILESYVAEIERLAPNVVAEYEKRLTERVEELLAGADIDKTRIVEEVAIFADRVAIDEELVRLKSHIAQFRAMLREDGDAPRGRKLDFLLQEINREINTTGSKCTDAAIAKIVVDAKSEAEKIREQVQNLE